MFAAVSPGGEVEHSLDANPNPYPNPNTNPNPNPNPNQVEHSLDGRRIAFESAAGTFLERSWGYVASWYLLARDA